MKFSLSKKRIAILTAAAVCLIAVIAFASRGKPAEAYVTDTVKKGDVTQTVEVTGDVSAVTEADLSFPQSGIIERMNVTVGDFVKAGQVLAELVDGGLSADVAKALADLNLKKAGPTSADVAMAEAQIAIAEANKASADITASNAAKDIALVQASSKADVDAATIALAKAQADYATAGANTNTSDILRESVKAVTSVRSALSAADQILGVENPLFNQNFKRELSAANPIALDRAINTFRTSAEYRDLSEAKVFALNASSTPAAIQDALTFVDLALQTSDETLLYTRQVLDATFADSVDLSLADIVSYKSMIDNARQSLENEISAFAQARQSGEAARLSVETAEANLAKATAQAAQNNASAAANLASAKASVQARAADVQNAEANYQNVTDDPRTVDLAPYYALVSGAQARLRNAQVHAPFAGKVTAVKSVAGEAASFGSPVIALQATGKAFEIKTNIPESDVAKIMIGNKAEITLDAFGDGKVFLGEVTALDQSEKIIEGVVFYEATVILSSANELTGIKTGMSADVSITTNEKTAVLYVPQRAILEHDGQKYVRVAKGESYEERNVITGLRGDDGQTEIVSGVNQGETIVVSIKK